MKSLISIFTVIILLSSWSCQSDAPNPSLKIKLLGSYRQEKALDIKAGEQGKIYILGSTTVLPAQNEDLLLVTLDETGKELSTLVWGRQWLDNEGSLWAVGNDLWVLSTEAETSTDTDMKLRRFDAILTPSSLREFPNRERQESSAKIRQDSDGNLLCLGTSSWIAEGEPRSGLYFYKVTEGGEMIWPQGRLIQQQAQQLKAIDFLVLQNSSKATTGYLILAETDAEEGELGPHNLMLLKTDQNGNLEDTRVFGSAEVDQGVGLSAVPSGGYLVASNIVDNNTAQIFRLDESLSEINPPNKLSGFSVSSLERLPDGNFLLGGTFESGANGKDMAIWKVNANGERLSDKPVYFGYEKDEIGVKAIAVGERENYQIILIGNVDFGNENSMIGYIKTDRDGKLN